MSMLKCKSGSSHVKHLGIELKCAGQKRRTDQLGQH
jgi:hypothetical protein